MANKMKNTSSYLYLNNYAIAVKKVSLKHLSTRFGTPLTYFEKDEYSRHGKIYVNSNPKTRNNGTAKNLSVYRKIIVKKHASAYSKEYILVNSHVKVDTATPINTVAPFVRCTAIARTSRSSICLWTSLATISLLVICR